jgi:replicative DNA helicase
MKTKRPYRYPDREENEDRSAVEKYLALRKISKETLDYCDVQQDKDGNIVWHYYDANDVLLTVKYRPSHKPKKNEDKAWAQKNKDTSNILFNMNRIDITQPLIVTEGEIDALSIIEAGYKNVVSVPFGANNEKWVEECWEWLEQFEKIILWVDNDAPGINMRKAVCARLGSWRTYFVDLPLVIEDKQVKDANEVLYWFGKEKILELINSPSEIPVSGVINLFDVNDYDIETAQGLYTGFSDIDNQIYKIVSGTLTIITGMSSSGKSVWVNQTCICQALHQGYDCFVLSAELPSDQFKSWIEWNLAGRENIDVKNNHIRKIKPEPLKKIRDWYNGRLFLYDDNNDNLTPQAILSKMEEMARKFGTKVFVLDNLMMIDFECSESAIYEKQKEFIIKLRNFANKFNVWVFLVAHPKKIECIRRLTKLDVGGSGAITNAAHYVIGIHRYTPKEKKGERGSNGRWKKEPIPYDCVMDWFKNRITGKQDFSVDLYFDLPSYRFYTKPEELWMRYKWDITNPAPIRTGDPNDHDQTGFMKKKENE